MRYDTIIANGTLVHADGTEKADVAVSGEQIAAVGKKLARKADAQTRIIDADGCYVLPGALDVHVHLELPFCGTVSSDDYDSGTRAAACGGVTTVIDFAIPYGNDSLADALANWKKKAEHKACVDYTFHIAVTKWDRHRHEMKEMVSAGFPTFKQFMIYAREGWQADDAAMYGALEQCRELGGMLLVHAESSRVLDELIERHHNDAEMREYGARLHALTRPNFIEAEAIQRAVTWAEATGGPLYIVHMSTAEGTDIIRRAHKRGLDHVFAETCAQYLVLDDSLFAGPDGHLFACCPQIKKKPDQKRLWQGLADGDVCAISTDTCTFTREQKATWNGDWTKIPMGLPGVETLMPIVYTHGVLKDRLRLTEMVNLLSTRPAKVMGLYPRKGALRKGSDADLSIIHPKRKIKVDPAKMQTRCDWSPYDGWSLAGFARTTLCRGMVVVDDYRFVGQNGWGKLLTRGPLNHANGRK
ncbi:MAG: dihydropyrimidinase [Phycisphaerae bacterium]